ncbi:hypothetical protein GFC29_1964 [Anoxybacillus sp. B7M1]|nr:hypothetical protein GFC28_3470 [Anoxybacillus sp. B2M1]ANB65646.1 hypothetical protein GFC29_1964 [Anoxybacillus sp. B7M1]
MSIGEKADTITLIAYLYTSKHRSEDRGANFKSRHLEENGFQRKMPKGEARRSGGSLIAFPAGPAFKKCRTVKMTHLGELSHCVERIRFFSYFVMHSNEKPLIAVFLFVSIPV